MKRLITIMISAIMAFALASCSSGAGETAASVTQASSSATVTQASETSETEAVTSEETTAASVTEAETTAASKVLVVYFSATGTTKGVAQKIAAIENADIYEIVPQQPYTSADLNYNDKKSRTTREQNDKKSRPGIAGNKLDLSGYSKIYVGYPIWWYEEPRIMDTFVETYDFGSITVIPFCTSGGSGIGKSGTNLAKNAKSGNWLSGARLKGNISENDLSKWISGLK